MSERLYTQDEVDRVVAERVRQVVGGILSGLTRARNDRDRLPPARTPITAGERRGEVYALNLAISLVRRRMS